MADKLGLDRTTLLNLAGRIKKISEDNDAAIKALDSINSQLQTGWQADAQKAYEECFLQMKSKLNTYTALLAEYSDTLTKVTNGFFSTDTEYANNIRSKYGS